MFAAGRANTPASVPTYIEDVFSAFVYTGTGANRTIETGLSLGYKSTPAQTSVSGRLRDYEGVDYFYNIGANQGTFLGATGATGWQTPQWIKVDFLTPVTVYTCTYRNSIPQAGGSQWAPSTVQLQSSSDDVNWTTRVSYNDTTGTEAQSGAIQYIHYTGSETARYWRMFQATDTRGGTTGYNWGFGSFGMYTSSGGNGGLVWIKGRTDARNSNLIDTERGLKTLYSESNLVQDDSVTSIRAFNSTNSSSLTPSGLTLGTENSVNFNGDRFCAWTFRQQPKFFDIVTYTGNGSSQTISHNLGSTPGCIMIKRTTSTASNWIVYHRGLASPNSIHLKLNSNVGQDGNAGMVNGTSSTTFSVGSEVGVNASGGTYVAYIFAHDAGGFGLSGTDSVIKCDSYIGSNSDVDVNLGWEPQWLIVVNATNATGTSNWNMVDNIRGFPTAPHSPAILRPNLVNAETATGTEFSITSTGFIATAGGGGGSNYLGDRFVYIAIRNGPMKVPTAGTSVFNTVLRTGTSAAATVTGAGFAPDLVLSKTRTPNGNNPSGIAFDRLRGVTKFLNLAATSQESTGSAPTGFTMDGYSFASGASDPNINTYTYSDWNFRRAPGFFDQVAYAGGQGARDIPHNLKVTPEFVIVKLRTGTTLPWRCFHKDLGINKYIDINYNNAVDTNLQTWRDMTPTTFGVKATAVLNENSSAYLYIAYLFASLPGVSKVGSYTGTGTTLQVDCGFTAGARFVLIKRTDATGDWYVWDSSRGIISGNDPFLILNDNVSETTNTDYIDPSNAGFEISSSAPSAINASGGNFIFLAIA
jgi:hypothetical protein